MDLGAVRLRSVLDDLHAELPQRLDVGAETVEMNGDDRARSFRQGGARGRRIERPGARIDVGEHRHRACSLDACDRRDARVRGNDHLVAGPHTDRAQRDRNRVRSGGDADRLAGAAPACEGALELRHPLAEDETAAVEHRRDRAVELRAKPLDLARELEERHVHRSPQ